MMKNLIISAAILASASTAFADNYFDDKVFKKPVSYSVPYTNDDCIITSINRQEGGTTIEFEHTTGYLIAGSANYAINFDAALVDKATGKSYPVLDASGNMAKYPAKFALTKNYSPYRFSLLFPYIPEDVKTLDLELSQGLGLDWTFKNINIGAVPVEKGGYSYVNHAPEAEYTSPGLSMISAMRLEDMGVLHVQYKALKPVDIHWGTLTAIDRATGKSYNVFPCGLPRASEKNPLYMRTGQTNAGIFIISHIPAETQMVDILEGQTPIIKGIRISN